MSKLYRLLLWQTKSASAEGTFVRFSPESESFFKLTILLSIKEDLSAMSGEPFSEKRLGDSVASSSKFIRALNNYLVS